MPTRQGVGAQLRAGRPAALYAAAVGAKIGAGIVVLKLLAIMAPPETMGRLGQLMSLAAIVGMLAGAGISNGIIAQLARLEPDSERWNVLLGSVFAIWVTTAIVIGAALLAGSGRLALTLMGAEGVWRSAIALLAAVQVLVGVNTIFLSILSSRRRVGQFAMSNIAGLAAGLACLVLAWRMGSFDGAVYGLVLMPAFPAVFSGWFVISQRVVSLRNLASPRSEETWTLLQYSAAGLVASILIPASHLFAREVVAKLVGWNPVGQWQAALKISEIFMQFFGVFLINHALPRLAAADEPARLRQVVFGTYAVILPVFVVGATALLLSRGLVIEWFLTARFAPVADYLGPQMLGDFLKLLGIVPSYILLAWNRPWAYLALEGLQSALFAFILCIGATQFLAFASVYAYVLGQLAYLGVAFAVLRHLLLKGGQAEPPSRVERCES